MEAITREEKIMSGENLTPITRKEMFLAKAAGQNIETPEPITREEMFLSKISGGGGGGATIEPLTITENGTYTAPMGVDGYSPVTVEVKGSGGVKFTSGSFTVAETVDLGALRKDGEYYKIEHGLGVKPTYFAVTVKVNGGYNAGQYGLISQVLIPGHHSTVMSGSSAGDVSKCYRSMGSSSTNIAEDYVNIIVPKTGEGYYGKLNAGITYEWFAIAAE